MKSDNLGFADNLTITATRLPGGKFSIRSGTSQIETAILAIGCSLVIFRENPGPPHRRPRSKSPGLEVKAPETDDEWKRVPGRALCRYASLKRRYTKS